MQYIQIVPKPSHTQNLCEEILQYKGKKIVYFLQISITPEVMYDLTGLHIGISKRDIGARSVEEWEGMMEHFREAGIPDKYAEKYEDILSASLEKYRRKATIIVPGYIVGTGIDENDRLVSIVETIDNEDKPEIIKLLRRKGLDGPVNFQ